MRDIALCYFSLDSSLPLLFLIRSLLSHPRQNLSLEVAVDLLNIKKVFILTSQVLLL